MKMGEYMTNNIFDKNLDDYLNEMGELEITNEEDLSKIKADYEEDILKLFQEEKYNFLVESKNDCVNDFFNQKRLKVSFVEGFDFVDLVETISWNDDNFKEVIMEIEERIQDAKTFTKELKDGEIEKNNIKEFLNEWAENIQTLNNTLNDE